jgi:hypothetical protein
MSIDSPDPHRPAPPACRRQALGLFAGWLAAGSCLLSGCAVLDVKASGPLHGRTGWVLLPVQNQGEAAMAGERVEELLLTLMRSQKEIELTPYPTPLPALPSDAKDPKAAAPSSAKDPDPELSFDDRLRYERAVAWARDKKYAYGIGGSVSELRYRPGSDGEPAVGLTVRVVDLSSGRVVFTASAANPPLGQGSLSATSQKLLRSIIDKLPVD